MAPAASPDSSAWSRPGRPVDQPLRPGGTWSRPALATARGVPPVAVDDWPAVTPTNLVPASSCECVLLGRLLPGLAALASRNLARVAATRTALTLRRRPVVAGHPGLRRGRGRTAGLAYPQIRRPDAAGPGPRGVGRRGVGVGPPRRDRPIAGIPRHRPGAIGESLPGLPAPSGAAARRTRVAPAGPLQVAGSVRQGVDHALVVVAGSLEDLASPSWIARHFAAAPFLPATWVGGDRRRRLPPTYPRCPWPRPSITRSRFAGPGLPADDPDLGPVCSPTAEESAMRTISIQEWPGFRALPADRNSLEGGRGRADRVVGRRIHQDVRVGHAGHPWDGSHAGGNRSNVGGGRRRRGSAGPDLPVIRVRGGLGA